jgi:Spy/CpxP family protein refolding chaperone
MLPNTKLPNTKLPRRTRTRLATLLPPLALAVVLAGCATTPPPGAGDPARPYAGLERRPIKALAPERVADLVAGRGAGYALAAELNSYPGPRHVLDLAAGLALTPEQKQAAEGASAAMEAEARRLGQELVEREAALDRAFAGGAATADEVTRLAGEAAATEGQLRAVHLRAHLAMRAALTPEQVARYDRLRGYAGATAPRGGGHGAGGHG